MTLCEGKNMKKYLLMAAAISMLFSTPVQACGSKACDLKNCDYKGTKAKACPTTSTKASAYKKSGHYHIPGKKPTYIRKILNKADVIGLSDRQRKQIGELLISAETGAAKAHAQAQITVAEFRSKLHSGNLSDADIKAYTNRMGALRSAKLAANLNASVKASRLLSDEQKSRLYARKGYVGVNK